MFAFCVGELGFFGGRRLQPDHGGARGAPASAVIEAARSGRVHPGWAGGCSPHLNDDNHEAVLAQAAGKSKREIEELVRVLRRCRRCGRDPQAAGLSCGEVGSHARACGAAGRADCGRRARRDGCGNRARRAGPGRRATRAGAACRRASLGVPQPVVDELPSRGGAAQRETFKVQFTASRRCATSCGKRKTCCGHRVPDGDVPTIIERALELLIEEVKKERFGVGRRPRPAASVATGQTEQIGDAGQERLAPSRPSRLRRATFPTRSSARSTSATADAARS